MPVRINADVMLFCTTPVFAVPTAILIKEFPDPVPLLVIVPVLFTLVVDKVMPLAVLPLLLSTKLPVPDTPPLTVNVPTVSVRVVVDPTVRAVVVMFNADVALF